MQPHCCKIIALKIVNTRLGLINNDRGQLMQIIMEVNMMVLYIINAFFSMCQQDNVNERWVLLQKVKAACRLSTRLIISRKFLVYVVQ